jgi:hypothetical protein
MLPSRSAVPEEVHFGTPSVQSWAPVGCYFLPGLVTVGVSFSSSSFTLTSTEQTGLPLFTP